MGGVTDIVDRTLGTDIGGKRALGAAQQAQGQGVAEANFQLGQGYQQQADIYAPWRSAGMGALARLQSGDIQMDPGYQFRLGEGNKAINAAASARGGFNSGATLKELARYGQNFATNEYGNAWNRQNQLANYGFNADNSLAQLRGNYDRAVADNYLGRANAMGAASLAGSQMQNQLLGQGIQAGTTALMFSDMRLKTNVESITEAQKAEMRKHLKAFKFNYLNDTHGKGDWVGVMAQDLEKSELGRTLVIENEKGEKMIDTNKVLSMFLASEAL